MSLPALSIERAAPLDPALNYSVLVAEGTALLHALSGDIWTNFNYSDPGVTILEQLCYALTELAYRADFPVQDLLGAPGSGHVALRRHGLHQAHAIMPVNPVTPGDLRRLLIDRVPDLANIWFTPLAPCEAGGVGGLYRIDVLAQPGECECEHPARESLREAVLDCYGAHRALCEDVHACHVLVPLATRASAEVCLANHADPDAVLAQLLFVLGLALAPEPKRRSLAQQRGAGLSTAEIFHGPLMLRGFIDDDQLTPLSRQVAVAALLEAMVEVAGVVSVDDLAVRVDGDPHCYGVDATVPVPDGCILRLAPRAAQAIRLWRDGVPCTPDPVRVQRLLERAWGNQRQTYPLWAEYRACYETPAGTGADLAAYSSVQDQFPAVYGIGAFGLPSAAGPARQAQARQLKGYLMAFDQLMADFFSQLAFVRELFSVGAGGDRTYAWQSLRASVPDAAPLLMRGYEEGMNALCALHDPVLERQSAMLDFLLSLYATGLDAPAHGSGGARARAQQGTALLRAKQALLARVVPATRARGRGFDYRRASLARDTAGMAVRCRIELALLRANPDAGGARPDAGETPLYIVEWTLLRHAMREGAGGELAADDFSFRISAVMPARDEDEPGSDEGWRGQARAIVRANTPAHVAVHDLFLGRVHMRRFRRRYDAWVAALRHGTPQRRHEASLRLARFLRMHG